MKFRSIHPGEILNEEFIKELNLSPGKIAMAIHVPRQRIQKICNFEADIDAELALRFSKLFGTTPEFWLDLQSRYNLAITRDKTDLANIIPIVS